MLVLLNYRKKWQEFQQTSIDNGFPTLMDYNPELKGFSTTRQVVIDTGWDEDRLRSFLVKHPGACIYNTLSHEPIGEKILIDGDPYIDPFGLCVYISSNISWYPHKDVDERFNYEEYPEDQIGMELYDYFNR